MRSSAKAKSLALFGAFALSLITMIFLFNEPVMAQATTGTLKGTVVDPNGGIVAGATVTARNEATGIEVTSTSNSDGAFTFSNLLPGKYRVTVATSSGFKTKQVTGIDVKLGTETDIKVSLEVGTPSETVTIIGNTEEIVQTNSQISSSFETRKVEELPSNAAGGGIDTLALLAPGVVPGFGNVNGNGITLSVNGNRARSNNFTLDGTDNNDLSIGGPSLFVDNAEAVAEFQIITNNYSAQYGRNQGAVVNIVTKSGTNSFHGSGFEFHRNSSALDAMTNQQRADPTRGARDKFVSNVFGGTFGGPIIKNKAFFFVDGQLIRQREGFIFATGNQAITPAGLATLAATYPGNAAIAALVNQSIFAIQPQARVRAGQPTGYICFPRDFTLAFACDPDITGVTAAALANGLAVPTGLPEYPLPLPFDEKHYGLRGDVNPTSRDSFNVKYRYQQSPETGFLGQGNGFFGDIPFSSKNLNGAYTRQIGSHAVNEFKAAWQKLSVVFGGCANSDPLKGCIPTATQIGNAFTNITFTGIASRFAIGGVTDPSLGTPQSIGPATNLPQGRIVRVAQFADTLNWTLGNHTLTMGVDFRDLNNSVPFLPNFNGAFRFNSTARIVANAPAFVNLAAGTPTIGYKEKDQFYFFQDDFKVRENLTLNLGIRYEYTGQPINILNQLTVAKESNAATALWRQSLPLEARTVPRIPADKNNWAPRLGFAWSPRFGDGKLAKTLFGENDATVIRGGFSIAYDPAFYNILLNVSTSAPTVFLDQIVNNTSLTAPLFRMPANPTGEAVRASLSSFLRRDTFDPRLLAQTQVGSDFHSPYSRQWSFGIQRQINRNNVAEVRYVGNRGVGLFQTVNRNPFLGTTTRNTNPASSCFNQFTNGGLANGFCISGIVFPGFPGLIPPGVTPVSTSGNDPATPDNEAADDGRIISGRGLIRSRENTGESSYHGLQARYNGRLFNQLTLGASYTFSKTIDNASEIFSFGEIAIAANPFDLTNRERGLSGNDRRHAGSMNFIWDVPVYKNQKGFVGHVLGGWQLNGTYVLASGRPFTPSQFLNVLGLPTYQDVGFTGTFFGFDNVRGYVGNRNAPRDTVGISDIDAFLFFTGVFTASPTGYFSLNELNATGNLRSVTANDVRYIINGPGAARYTGNPFGNIPRNSERGPALNHLNIGIFKNTRIRENVRLQLRAELFNALNHPNPGYGVAGERTLPDTFMEDAGVPGSLFNDKRAMELSSRRVQFGIKLIF
jgi:outer membrane receptor protein involved in Fe transport